MRPSHQTLVLILVTKVAVDRSALQPATIFTYVMKSTNVYVWNMFHHVINYQHVSIPFAIIGVDLQEYKEYNNLRHWISGTTKSYNKCYPDGDDKSDRYMLIINNSCWHISYICICWFFLHIFWYSLVWNILSQVLRQPFVVYCIHNQTYVVYWQAHFDAN